VEKKGNRRLWLTLALLWFAHFTVDFMIGIWPVFKTIRQLDLATVGIITAIAVVLGEGLQPLFGALCDAGWRKMVLVGGILASSAAVFYTFFGEYTMFFILLLVTCIGSGAFHPAATTAASALSKRHKAFVISIFISGGAFGLAASQLVFTKAYIAFAGNTLFLALPVVLIALILCYYRLHEAKTPAAATKKRISLASIKTFFRRKELRQLYFIQVCNQSIWWGMIFLLPDILSQRGYETWISLGGGHLSLILGGAAMMIPAGYLADRFSTKTVLFTASLCSLVSLYTFLAVPLLPPSALFPLLFCLGASLGVVNPISVAQGNRWAPSNPGLVTAMMMGLAWCVSEGIGQGIGGLLTKLFESDAAAKAIACEGLLLIGFSLLAARLPTDQEVVIEEEAVGFIPGSEKILSE